MDVLYKGGQHVGMMGMGREQANIDKEQVGVHKEEDMNREQVGMDKEEDMNWEQVWIRSRWVWIRSRWEWIRSRCVSVR